MKSLILDTSGSRPFLLLAKDGKALSSIFLESGPLLSKTLGARIKEFLGSLRPERIVMGAGPGSYTGVRVGAAMAQALAFGWQIPLFGFPSLQAFAPETEKPFAILADARMGGLYCQRGKGSEFHPPELLSANEAPVLLANLTLFSPESEQVAKRASFLQPVEAAEPNFAYLAALSDGKIPGLQSRLSLAYLDRKT